MESRTQLPLLRPFEAPPIWKIMSKFIGQDLTKVSMPVVLNEPLTMVQRTCEGLISCEEYFERAANFEDPVKRITYMIIAFCGTISMAKVRKKKAFNSMLGETYELVTDRVKFIAEKV